MNLESEEGHYYLAKIKDKNFADLMDIVIVFLIKRRMIHPYII
jgi:hypothetical protein